MHLVGAFADLAVDIHVAARLLDEALHLAEPEAGALAGPLGREEGDEHMGQDLVGDAGPRIADLDLQARVRGITAEHLHAHIAPHGVVDAVGFSLGAITLLRTLTTSPQSFGTVVLAGIGNGVFQPHDPSNTERILAGLEGRSAPGDITARIFGKIGNEVGNDPLALAAVLRRPRQGPFTAAQLAQISNPVVVAVGDKDFSHPADELAAAFTQGRLVVLPGIDHFRTPESFEFIDLVMSLFA